VINLLPGRESEGYDDYNYTGGNCRTGAICSGDDTADGGTNDVVQKATAENGVVTFEVKHPFAGTDPHDFKAAAGDTINWRVQYRLIGPNANWPQGFGDTIWSASPNTYVIASCKKTKS